MSANLLQVESIVKSFPGVRALDGVSFTIGAGEICTIAGENGAGKSTLLGVLGGSLTPDAGTVTIDGVLRKEYSPRNSLAEGVLIAFQEPAVVPQLTVAQNAGLGRTRSWRKEFPNSTKRVLEDMALMGFPTFARARVQELSPAQRQAFAIARAFASGARIVALDEPTTSMLESNVVRVLERISEIARQRKLAVLFVSHKMSEVMRVSDSVVVLRDGKSVFRSAIAKTSEREIVHKMVGRELLGFTREHPVKENAPVRVEFSGVKHPRHKTPLNFQLRAGEVLGISGLVGSGRTELLRAIIRADSACQSKISIDGVLRRVKDPHTARSAGIAFIPEERKRQGLVAEIPAYANIALTADRQFNIAGILVSKKREIDTAAIQTSGMSLRPANVHLLARQFSGGNQQKIVIAKWTWRGATVFLFDEPTKGVDVGGRVEIYRLIDRLASEGKSVVVVSSDLPEIISISDRVLVMREGSFVGEFVGKNIDEKKLVASAMGIAEGKQ